MTHGDSSAILPRPQLGAATCPCCRVECSLAQGQCVCAVCLTRHHLGCWEEGGGCARCRSRARAPISPRLLAALFALVALTWAVVAWLAGGRG